MCGTLLQWRLFLTGMTALVMCQANFAFQGCSDEDDEEEDCDDDDNEHKGFLIVIALCLAIIFMALILIVMICLYRTLRRGLQPQPTASTDVKSFFPSYEDGSFGITPNVAYSPGSHGADDSNVDYSAINEVVTYNYATSDDIQISRSVNKDQEALKEDVSSAKSSVTTSDDVTEERFKVDNNSKIQFIGNAYSDLYNTNQSNRKVERYDAEVQFRNPSSHLVSRAGGNLNKVEKEKTDETAPARRDRYGEEHSFDNKAFAETKIDQPIYRSGADKNKDLDNPSATYGKKIHIGVTQDVKSDNGVAPSALVAATPDRASNDSYSQSSGTSGNKETTSARKPGLEFDLDRDTQNKDKLNAKDPETMRTSSVRNDEAGERSNEKVSKYIIEEHPKVGYCMVKLRKN